MLSFDEVIVSLAFKSTFKSILSYMNGSNMDIDYQMVLKYGNEIFAVHF